MATRSLQEPHDLTTSALVGQVRSAAGRPQEHRHGPDALRALEGAAGQAAEIG
jgi:hypothetical protein